MLRSQALSNGLVFINSNPELAYSMLFSPLAG